MMEYNYFGKNANKGISSNPGRSGPDREKHTGHGLRSPSFTDVIGTSLGSSVMWFDICTDSRTVE